MSDTTDFSDAIMQLNATINARKGASSTESYTAALLAGGAEKCAKKLGEEAVELAIASVSDTQERVASEAADVIYHLLVLLAARDVPLSQVGAILREREGVSGVVEKAARKT